MGIGAARFDYGDPDEAEYLTVDAFRSLLRQWGDHIGRAPRTKQLPHTYRRNEVAPIAGPTREEVERRWLDLIAGTRSREETAPCARPWVLAPMTVDAEILVESALQTLDGFDITHDPVNRNLVRHGGHREGRPYDHSDEQVRDELTLWLRSLDEHDQDPVGFFERISQRARGHRDGERWSTA